MKIRFLGAHNCESQNSRCTSLLIDDVLALDAGGLTSSLSFTEQLKLRAILLTHRHYDHIRDIPAVAMNFFLREAVVHVYSTQPVRDALATNLLNGELYPKFLEYPGGNPAVKFTVVEPFQTVKIDSYKVMPMPVNHSDHAISYQVSSPDGKVVVFTGDTGPGLADCWKQVSPQLLVTEVTASNRFEEFARQSGHLTPGLLQQELASFRDINGYLPQVALVHMNPDLEEEIAEEIATVAVNLGSPIVLAYAGMEIVL